jgi:hypothetical protein
MLAFFYEINMALFVEKIKKLWGATDPFNNFFLSMATATLTSKKSTSLTENTNKKATLSIGNFLIKKENISIWVLIQQTNFYTSPH